VGRRLRQDRRRIQPAVGHDLARPPAAAKAWPPVPHRAARASRRLPEEKLSGFWQENVVAVNTVLDEADSAADRKRWC
jgi:hypothetical protein